MASTATARATWTAPQARPVRLTLVRPTEARRPVVADEPTCACGQALEWSHTAHCPRCGVTLRSW